MLRVCCLRSFFRLLGFGSLALGSLIVRFDGCARFLRCSSASVSGFGSLSLRLRERRVWGLGLFIQIGITKDYSGLQYTVIDIHIFTTMLRKLALYIYIYIYVCMYVCICMYVYTHTYIYIYIYMCVYIAAGSCANGTCK